jgi:hypothetical protein
MGFFDSIKSFFTNTVAPVFTRTVAPFFGVKRPPPVMGVEYKQARTARAFNPLPISLTTVRQSGVPMAVVQREVVQAPMIVPVPPPAIIVTPQNVDSCTLI